MRKLSGLADGTLEPDRPARIQAEADTSARSHLRPRLGVALGAATVIAALLAVLLIPVGAQVAPSVSQAAALAFRGSAGPAPSPDPKSPASRLALRVQRVYFPNLSARFGWAAVGQRTDYLAGRRVVTVYYQAYGSKVEYTIVSGPALARPSGTIMRIGAQHLRLLSIDGRLILTWRGGGHTCLLSGTGVTSAEMAGLALWRYNGGS
jgi:hypothetical protein